MSDDILERKSAQRVRILRSVTQLGRDSTNLQQAYESAASSPSADPLPLATQAPETRGEVASSSSLPGPVTKPVELTLEERENLPFHPFSEIFPLLDDADLAELARDIQAHGLHEPLVLVKEDGKWRVLDGRNRYRAIVRHLSL